MVRQPNQEYEWDHWFLVEKVDEMHLVYDKDVVQIKFFPTITCEYCIEKECG
jgi:hypothetical protein